MTSVIHFLQRVWSFLFVLGFLFSGQTIAQSQPPQDRKLVPNPPAGKESFIIKNVHTTKDSNSVIEVSLELMQNAKPLREDFRLFNEDGNPIEVQQLVQGGSEDDAPTSTRLIYFLIDASNYTEGTHIKNFKSAVKSALGSIGESDLVNVGYFGSNDEIITINREFGANLADLGSDIETRISANSDSVNKTDAFKSMFDAIDVLRNANKDGQRILIVVSGGMKGNNPEYSTDNVAAYARKHNIMLHNVVYSIKKETFAYDSYRIISSKTDGGLSFSTKNSTELKNALGNCLEKRAVAPKNVMLLYKLTFLPPFKDGAEHSFKLAYAGTEQVGKYIAPTSGGGGGGFLWIFTSWIFWGALIAILLAVLLYWQINEARLRKIEREEEEMQRQEDEERQRQAEIAKREKQQDAVIQELRSQTARLEEQMRQKEQDMLQRQEDLKAQIQFTPTVIPPAKFDMKNTIISGGGGSPVLLVAAGSFSNNFYLNKPTMNIGRAANNDIVIPEQTVSNHHARITIENGSFFLTDLGSTNGTFVNGTRVDRKLLKPGDIIKFGAANSKFEV